MFHIYRLESGRLDSSTADANQVAAPGILAARGLCVVEGPALDRTHRWDDASHSVIEVAAEPEAFIVPTYEFVLRFAAGEMAAIRASSDATAQQLLFALGLTQEVDVASERVQQGLAYLVSVDLLTQERAGEIGATT